MQILPVPPQKPERMCGGRGRHQECKFPCFLNHSLWLLGVQDRISFISPSANCPHILLRVHVRGIVGGRPLLRNSSGTRMASKPASLGCGCDSRARGCWEQHGSHLIPHGIIRLSRLGGQVVASVRLCWTQLLQCHHRTRSQQLVYVLVPRFCSRWLPMPQAHSGEEYLLPGHYSKCLRTIPDWTVWITCPSLSQSLWAGLC